MRPRWLLGTFAAVTAAGLVATFSGCTTILGTFDVAPAGPAKGAACAAATDCGTGFCVDGVCCESACSGTCEACNLPGQLGTCAPIPDGQNPASECPTLPLATADGGLDDDAGAIADGGSTDAGRSFNLPSTGVSTNDAPCAGTCNGQRACRFPSTEATCGTTFCTTPTAQARATCDGAGHCQVIPEACTAYSCLEGALGCQTRCTSEADCLPTHFCEATTSTCKPKLGNGSACSSLAQCQDSHCVSGVCCNDECTGFPGATCTTAGHVGECRCDACANGTCQLFYRDEDGDGYGDKNGTLANGRAKPGCVGAPPTGFVDDNTDCFDTNTSIAAQVHPNQTGYFSSPYAGPNGQSYDYDCDGALTKQIPEFPGSYCGLCSGFLTCSSSASCTTAGTQGTIGCAYGFGGCGGIKCIGHCYGRATSGFSATVDCGATGTESTCGVCNGSYIPTTYASRVQGCR